MGIAEDRAQRHQTFSNQTFLNQRFLLVFKYSKTRRDESTTVGCDNLWSITQVEELVRYQSNQVDDSRPLQIKLFGFNFLCKQTSVFILL